MYSGISGFVGQTARKGSGVLGVQDQQVNIHECGIEILMRNNEEKIMSTINISKLDKAHVLMALYNNSKPLGLGFLHATSEPMKLVEAKALLCEQTYFDYLKGRVMKIDLSTNDLRVDLYDRDNGAGAAEEALRDL